MWDLGDEEFLKEVGTLGDQVIEYREGNEIGYGIIECGVSRGYAKYEEVQHLPAF